MNHTTMKDMPESERPYERFRRLGAEALSDAELLAIILKTGTREITSLALARELLSKCHGNLLNLYELSFEELTEHRGIGPVKATQLKAVAELSGRIARTNSSYRLKFDNPESVALYYMETLRHKQKEIFMAAFFDAKCHFLGDAVIAEGGADSAAVAVSELFREALRRRTVQLIVLHNHPSGDPAPSRADRELTERICAGAGLLGLHVSDHIVIGDNRYYSFLEHDTMPAKAFAG